MVRTIALAFAVVVPALLRAQAAGGQQDAALVERVLTSERQFLARWRDAWKASEAERHPLATPGPGSEPVRARVLATHCHFDEEWGPPRDGGTLIRSRFSRTSVCPTFLLDNDVSSDESRRLDDAITDRHRPAIAAARDTLLSALDSAATLLPGNAFMAGQRVRFLVDQSEYDRALSAANACDADRSWCASLAGYVLAARGDMRSADSAFEVARAALPADARCEWADIEALLDDSGRAAVRAMQCPEREMLADRLWWLADPLYVQPGNERRVAQDFRRVLIALRSVTGRSERYDWQPRVGGDALREMVFRYGWPSYVYWRGDYFDESHGLGYLAPSGSPDNPPYTTYEYTPGRVSLVPSWRAILEPLDSRNSDWRLELPVGTDPMPEARGPLWPAEHFAPPYPITQLPDGQTALLRRADNVLLAVATELQPAGLQRPSADAARGAVLVRSTGPDSIAIIARRDGVVGTTLVLHGAMAARPAVIGVEIPPDTHAAHPAARARFGVRPPASLAALGPGEYAISDPVLLTAPATDALLPTDADAALQHMAGTTRVQGRERIGVFWETYGVQPSDTVHVEVSLERQTRASMARRLGQWLRLVPDRNAPVSVGWQEPQPAARVHVSAGRVPILGRSVVLDVSGLPAGDYWLTVAIARRGEEPVRGRRRITIERS